MNKQAIRVALFWTGAQLSVRLPPWEWIFVFGIKYFSRSQGQWLAEVCHMGVAFEFADGLKEIHEALFREGWTIKPFEKLEHFKARDPRNVVIVEWLDLPTDSVQRMYERSFSWQGMRYDNRLISSFALARSIVGRSSGLPVKDDPLRGVCSELASRLIYSEAPFWDLRARSMPWNKEGDGFASVAPQDALNRYRELRAARMLNLACE